MQIVIEKIIAVLLLILLSPLFVLVSMLIWVQDFSNPFFLQKRLGKNKNIFKIIKFRTMYVGAEKHQGRYEKINEADGPVFKIYNDPRFTKFGRVLAHTGLDELPQLINIIKGEMSFVGPRPLPPGEAGKISKKYSMRFSVNPGITSLWVVSGSHNNSFTQWMEMDMDMINNLNFINKTLIVLRTVKMIAFSMIRIVTGAPLVLAFILLIVGLILRIDSMLNISMWADEAMIFDAAKRFSMPELLTTVHIPENNPSGYITFLKLWSSVSNNLQWLRFSSILLFVLSFYLINDIFKHYSNFSRYFALFLYSLSTYFINVNFWISPYNLLIALALYQIKNIQSFINATDKTNNFVTMIKFILTNFLLFNTHYSAVLFFIFEIFIFLILKPNIRKAYFISLVLSGIVLLPNLFYLRASWEPASRIMSNCVNGEKIGIIFASKKIIAESFFRIREEVFGYAVAALLLLSPFFVAKKLEDKTNLGYWIGYGLFIASTIGLTVFSIIFPCIFVERTFGIAHLGIIFMISIIVGSPGIKLIVKLITIVLIVLMLTASVFRNANNESGFEDIRWGYIDSRNYHQFLNGFVDLQKRGCTQIHFAGEDIDASSYSQQFVFRYYYLPFVVDSEKVNKTEIVDTKTPSSCCINFSNIIDLKCNINFWNEINEKQN